MRNLFLSILVLAFSFQIAYAQKLTIIDQDYERAKNESKKQNKMLLVDFYTTWCAPCKEIERKIFNDPAISSDMSKSFVVLRYDAEKDRQHRLSLKHHVGMYPSTIVLNPDQFVLNKLIGVGGAEKDLVENYLALFKEAISKHLRNDIIKGVSNTNNLTYPKFYEDYVFRTNTKLDEAELKKYWETTCNRFSEVPFAILSYFEQPDEINDFFFENKRKYEELYGKLDIDFLQGRITGMKFFAAIASKNRTSLETAAQLTRKVYDQKKAEEIINSFELQMLKAENRWSEAIEKLVTGKVQGEFDEAGINGFCWSVNEKSNDKDVLKKCTEWMKSISKMNPKFEFLDTYARLLYKTGNKKLSFNIMGNAIKIGKTNKEDTKKSEDWLKSHR
jgi:thiol-disulfide isomerase/thioredoxin